MHTDAVEAGIVAGTFRAPAGGDPVAVPGGETRTWKAVSPSGGRVPVPRGGYAFCVVEAERAVTTLLAVRGHSMVYVNGAPRAGNPYRTGWYELPLRLAKGRNEFLFRCGRGSIEPAFRPIEPRVQLRLGDLTAPDLIAGETDSAWVGIPVVNPTGQRAAGLRIAATGEAVQPTETLLPAIPPRSLVKVAVRLRPQAREAGSTEVRLVLRGQGELDRKTIRLGVRKPGQRHKRTFRSAIDGSVQYYAVAPARPVSAGAGAPALFLTCHGAGVEATGQAAAYADKSWGHVVAPTNRRPFGFDWEDQGEVDALEVLADAQRHLRVDRSRVYLTGHSMGGHGTWHLGATFPSLWAAIGPSAGWISFFSYAGGRRVEGATPVEALLARAAGTSDTIALQRNFAQHGVYILHGAADDNVPVREARRMRDVLAKFHHDFVYHEQPGAGHWWDDSDEPGTGCVDWAPMFDFFARHRLPADDEVRSVDFTTMNPGVSARSHWVSIEAQRVELAPSRVVIRFDPGRRRFTGKTDNVARLLLRTSELRPGARVRIALDGSEIEVPWKDAAAGIRLGHDDRGWRVAGDDPKHKGPLRYGPFKQAFRNRFVLVPGTGGSAAERRWAAWKARYDAETFWYRGNGSVEVVPDRDFTPARYAGRNVVLYGNAATNAAWAPLLGSSPVRVEPGRIRIGARILGGDELCCLLVRPRPGETDSLVAAVAGTGLRGMRLTDRLPYFVSGVHYPDLFVAGPDVLATGSRGVRVAGFFGVDWSLEAGDVAWRD